MISTGVYKRSERMFGFSCFGEMWLVSAILPLRARKNMLGMLAAFVFNGIRVFFGFRSFGDLMIQENFRRRRYVTK